MNNRTDSAAADDSAAEPTLTAAVAAKHVRRLVPVIKDRKPTGELREAPVRADEVFAHSLRDGVVTVVTVDGKKLTADANPKLMPKAAKA